MSDAEKKIIKANDTKYAKKMETKFIDYIKNARHIQIAGDGDPFASEYYFDLLKSDLTQLNPKLSTIQLQTNATLLTKENWYLIHPNNRKLIQCIDISIDAVSPETYKKQRGGDFIALCENLKFVTALRRVLNISMVTAFTVTSYNYKEMAEFIEFADKFKFNTVQFWLMSDWGRGYSPDEIGVTRNQEEYEDFLIKTDEAKKIASKYPHMNIAFGF